MDKARPETPMEPPAAANLTRSDALNFLHSVHQALGDGSESYGEFLQVMSDYAEQKIDAHALIARVKTLLRGHQELIPVFNTFLPEEFKIKLPLEKETMPVEFDDMALRSVNSFRNRFGEDEHVYKSYVGITREVKTRKISLLDTYNEVVSLLDGHQDLIVQSTEVIDHLASTATQQVLQKRSLSPRDEEKPSDPAVKQPLTWNRLRTSSGGPQMNREKKGRHIEKKKNSFSETPDVTECRKCTPSYKFSVTEMLKYQGENPSYRFVPEVERPAPASGRTKLDASVLNDGLVSEPYEGYSSKPKRQSLREERWNLLEDDMFEMDVLLGQMNAAAQKVNELVEKIKANEKANKPQSPICIGAELSCLNLRCIERLYGKYGLDMLDALHKDPGRVLPAIAARLKQKVEELSERRKQFKETWAKVSHNLRA